MTRDGDVAGAGSLQFLPHPPPWTFVPVVADGAVGPLPRPLLVETIHDGELVPAELLPRDRVLRAGALGRLEAAHRDERDWGADLFAAELARELGLGGFGRVPIARAVLDVGRLPGVASPGDGHLGRRAIGVEAAPLLGTCARRRLLARYHRGAWLAQTRAVLAADAERAAAHCGVLRIAVHTFDPVGLDGRPRPPLSLLTRAEGVAAAAGWEPLAETAFGPTVPAWVGAATIRPTLAEALLAALAVRGLESTANDPYELPLGSLEIRLAVWWFRRRWRATPRLATAGSSGTQAARRARFEASPRRFETLVLEVRKDLLWRFANEVPQGPRTAEARALAAEVAAALRVALAG